MVKVSQIPPDSAPSTNDKIITYNPDASPPADQLVALSSLITLFFNNIPAGAIPGQAFDYVISGGVWSGDSYGSTRAASMTAISVYINGRTIAISAVTARTFTASKDTYVDVLDNLDGTGTLVYTEVTNNAASPALASNSLRIAIIVTGATTIAAVGSVNQGQENKVLPIASSVAYSVTDSLGNLICPRDSQRKLLCYRQVIGGAVTTVSTTNVQFTGLTAPVIVPTGRKVKITLFVPYITNTGSGQISYLNTWDGVVASGTQLQDSLTWAAGANFGTPAMTEIIVTPASTSKTYNAGIHVTGGTGSYNNASTNPAFIKVELV
jgi:hypothetical protein